jgi:hypothetical protein
MQLNGICLRAFIVLLPLPAAWGIKSSAWGQTYSFSTTSVGTCTCNSDTFNLQRLSSDGTLAGQCVLVSPTFTGSSGSQIAAATSATFAAKGTARSQSLAVTTIVSSRIRSISRDISRSFAPLASDTPQTSSGRGVSAGSPESLWGVWGSPSGSSLKNNTPDGYEGNSVVALAGIDYLQGTSWVIGVTAGYTHSDLTTKSVTGSRLSDGGLVGPYVSYIISPNFSADVQFQYTGLSNNMTAQSAGLKANFGGDRATGAFNLNAYADDGPIKFTGFSGYSYTWEGTQKNWTLSSIPAFSPITRFGVVNLGGEASYEVDPANHVEVYLPLTLSFETTTPRDGTSRFGVQPGIGVRWQLVDNIAAGVSLTTMEVKSHTRDFGATGHLRWTF